MSESPLVSILVPYLDGSKYLERLSDALLSQTVRDFEVLVTVAPPSKDEMCLIEESLSKLGNLKIIQQTGSGLGDARNSGITHASGEYIWFLDVDDYPLPTFLEELIGICESTNSDAVFCNHFQSNDDRIPIITDRDFKIKTYTRTEAISSLSELPVYSWSRIQKRKVFDSGECLFKEYGAMEDYDQTLREILCCNKVSYYGKPLYVYRRSTTSASSVNREKESRSLEEMCLRNLEIVKEKMPECSDAYLSEIINRMMRQPAFSSLSSFRKWYKESLIHNLIKDSKTKTTEMRVFELSATLYYLALLPFTHLLWEERKGVWGPL